MAYENNENKPVQPQQNNMLENEVNRMLEELTNNNNKNDVCDKIKFIIDNNNNLINNLRESGNITPTQIDLMEQKYNEHCGNNEHNNNKHNNNELYEPDDRNEREAPANTIIEDNRNEREAPEEHFSDGQSFQEQPEESFQEEQPVESFQAETTVSQPTVSQPNELTSNPAGSEVYLILQNNEPANDLSVYFNNLVSTDRNELTGRQQDCGAVENMDNLSRAVPGAYGILR